MVSTCQLRDKRCRRDHNVCTSSNSLNVVGCAKLRSYSRVIHILRLEVGLELLSRDEDVFQRAILRHALKEALILLGHALAQLAIGGSVQGRAQHVFLLLCMAIALGTQCSAHDGGRNTSSSHLAANTTQHFSITIGQGLAGQVMQQAFSQLLRRLNATSGQRISQKTHCAILDSWRHTVQDFVQSVLLGNGSDSTTGNDGRVFQCRISNVLSDLVRHHVSTLGVHGASCADTTSQQVYSNLPNQLTDAASHVRVKALTRHRRLHPVTKLFYGLRAPLEDLLRIKEPWNHFGMENVLRSLRKDCRKPTIHRPGRSAVQLTEARHDAADSITNHATT